MIYKIWLNMFYTTTDVATLEKYYTSGSDVSFEWPNHRLYDWSSYSASLVVMENPLCHVALVPGSCFHFLSIVLGNVRAVSVNERGRYIYDIYPQRLGPFSNGLRQ